MNEEIKVIIVDDEDTWRQSIAAALYNFGYSVAGTSGNFEEAVGLISTQDYDIALLDINLNGTNKGIELGKIVCNVYNRPYIFVTGSTDSHILQDAIDAGPSAYLTKPVHPSSLVATVQSAINNFNSKAAPKNSLNTDSSNYFFVKQGSRYKKIDWSKIVYLRYDQNYTIIYHEADKTEYYIRSTLSKTLNMIIPPHLRSSFVQVNRGEAVQLQYIQEMTGDELRTSQRAFTITEGFRTVIKKAVTLIS